MVAATREMGHHIVLRHMCDIAFALRVETSGWVEGVGWGECGCGCVERKRLMGNTQGAKGGTTDAEQNLVGALLPMCEGGHI